MLEALIRISDAPVNSPKGKGDIVCVKLSPATWGLRETKEFLIVKLEDAALETKLIAMQKAGEPFPVLIYPYAAYEVVTENPLEVRLVKASSKMIEIDKVRDISKQDIDDKTKDKGIVEKEDAPIIDRV